MKNTLTYKSQWGGEYEIGLTVNHYLENNNLFVGMVCYNGEPFANLTVNLSVPCDENCAFIDTNNLGMGIMAWLEKNNLGTQTFRFQRSGFCEYYEFKFDMDKVKKYLIAE